MEHFRITYDGTALQNHEMDVRLLAPALLAVGDLLENANRVLNQDHSKVVVNVRGSLKTGSVAIDFNTVQTIYSKVVDFLSGKETTAAVNLLALLGVSGAAGLLQVIKWLRGRNITKIETQTSVAVIYVDVDMLTVELAVLELLKDYGVRKSFETMLEPLTREGVDTFAWGTDTEIVDVIQKSEYTWFIAPPIAEEKLEPVTYEKTLQIERIEFNKENKWRFTDGTSSFYAVITDQPFLARIERGDAAFAANDTLRVQVIESQRLEQGKLKTSYEISNVLDHRKETKQIALNFVIPQGDES